MTQLGRVAALALAGAVPASAGAQQPIPALVFDRVTVVDVEQGKLLPDQQVTIVGNHIQAVGRAGVAKVPDGARVIDARGEYLIPGLWDMHVHPRNAAGDPFYPLLLANGITGIREAGSPIRLDTLLRWRREILAGTRVGPPRPVYAGPAISGPNADCQREEVPSDNEVCVTDVADARHLVDSLRAAGADIVKQREVSPALYYAIAAEARRIGLPFGGHANGMMSPDAPEVSALEASDSGARIIDHFFAEGIGNVCIGPEASVEACEPVAAHFRHNDTWLVPTIAIHRSNNPESPFADRFGINSPVGPRFDRQISAFWGGGSLGGAWLRDSAGGDADVDSAGFLRVVQRVGLPILAGTDANWGAWWSIIPPGFSLHLELAIGVAEGLTPLTALQSATLNPAKALHATDSLGTVAAGKLADLVLLDGNPLADITNTTAIRAVVANGRYFDRAALDRLLAEIQAERRKAEGEP